MTPERRFLGFDAYQKAMDCLRPGDVVTFDDMLNCDEEFAPGLDKLTMESPAPLSIGPDGRYPMPQPGLKKTREF